MLLGHSASRLWLWVPVQLMSGEKAEGSAFRSSWPKIHLPSSTQWATRSNEGYLKGNQKELVQSIAVITYNLYNMKQGLGLGPTPPACCCVLQGWFCPFCRIFSTTLDVLQLEWMKPRNAGINQPTQGFYPSFGRWPNPRVGWFVPVFRGFIHSNWCHVDFVHNGFLQVAPADRTRRAPRRATACARAVSC